MSSNQLFTRGESQIITTVNSHEASAVLQALTHDHDNDDTSKNPSTKSNDDTQILDGTNSSCSRDGDDCLDSSQAEDLISTTRRVYDLTIDPDQEDKATHIKFCSVARPHMRAFHCACKYYFHVQ